MKAIEAWRRDEKERLEKEMNKLKSKIEQLKEINDGTGCPVQYYDGVIEFCTNKSICDRYKKIGEKRCVECWEQEIYES